MLSKITVSFPLDHCATPFETPVIFLPTIVITSCNSSKFGRIETFGIIKVDCNRNIGFLSVLSAGREIYFSLRQFDFIYLNYIPPS